MKGGWADGLIGGYKGGRVSEWADEWVGVTGAGALVRSLITLKLHPDTKFVIALRQLTFWYVETDGRTGRMFKRMDGRRRMVGRTAVRPSSSQTCMTDSA